MLKFICTVVQLQFAIAKALKFLVFFNAKFIYTTVQ